MNSYDKYKEGLHDDISPINQSDLRDSSYTLTECLDDNNLIDEAYNKIHEIQKQVQALRDYANANENHYLLKRLNQIYNSL